MSRDRFESSILKGNCNRVAAEVMDGSVDPAPQRIHSMRGYRASRPARRIGAPKFIASKESPIQLHHRALISARSALVEAAPSTKVTPPSAAARALESTSPTGAAQVRPAMGLIRELILALHKRARKLHSDFLLGSHNHEARP